MKPSATAATIAVTAVTAFLLGRISTQPAGRDATAPQQTTTRPVAPSQSTASIRPIQGKSSAPAKLATLERISPERARQMTPQERIELLTKGAMVFDGVKQAELLCGVISSLSKDEIAEATRVLAEVQDRGNIHDPSVWAALWTQWGRVDPEGALKIFAEKPDGKSRSDSRRLMAGWWETDPEAALAWAKEPKTSLHDIEAAAMALSNSAGNDPGKLEQILQTLPPGDPRAKDALQDYLDMIDISYSCLSAAQAYEKLPPGLRDSAWSATLQRLMIGDPGSAVTWIGEHVSDPGFDPSMSFQLVQRVSNTDPAAAMKVATSLPASDFTQMAQQLTYERWSRSDKPAAEEWLDSQPQDSPLVQRLITRVLPQKVVNYGADLIWEDVDQ